MNVNKSMSARESTCSLIPAAEVLQELGKDEEIIIVPTDAPIRCTLAPYHAHLALKETGDPDPYYRGSNAAA